MGQTSSEERLPDWGNVQRQATTIKDLAFLSYEHFVTSLHELNKISQTFTDSDGKRLIFAVKRGTDSTLLWKATVKVGCVRVDIETKQIESYRLLNLKQFLQVYKLILAQVNAQNRTTTTLTDGPASVLGGEDNSNANPNSNLKTLNSSLAGSPVCMPMTTSVILNKVSDGIDSVDEQGSLEECCICMERKPEIILPCAHNYCLPCIEQWNVSSKTCPVCREEVENTDDSWVISEAPDSSEMIAEVQKLLSGLADVHNVS